MIYESHGYFLATKTTGETIACETRSAAESFAGTDGNVEEIPTRFIANDNQVKKLLVIFKLSRNESTVFGEEKLWDTFVKPNLPPNQQEAAGRHPNFVQSIQDFLDTTIYDLDLSVRTFNCLKAKGVSSLYEIIETTPNELNKMRNFGKKGMDELRVLLSTKGLSFEMDLTPYQKK